MIDISTDKQGETIRTLVWQSIKQYPTKHLFQFLHDKSPIVKTIAARELQSRGTKETFEHVVRLTKSESVNLREISAFILGQLGTPKTPYKDKSLPYLIKLCADKNSNVRSAAISALAHLRADKQKSVLINAAKDKSPQVRCAAAAAFLYLKHSPSSIKCLEQLQKDKNREVRSWAKTSLEFLSVRNKRKSSAKRKSI